MKTQTEVLALPLRDDIGLILDANGKRIAEIRGKDCQYPDIVAAEIVRRVNSHDLLVSSRERLIRHLESLIDGIAEGVPIPPDGAAVNAVREVIAEERAIA